MTRDPDDTDPLDDDDPGDEPDDDEGDDQDDDDDGDDGEDDGEADAEDRAGEARAPRPPTPDPTLVSAPVAETRPVPQVLTSERPRRSWVPLTDDRIGYVLVYRAGQSGNYLCRLTRPFPTGPLERWLLYAYGPGRYRLLERGHPPDRTYIGSLTVNVTEELGAGAAAAAGNGNGNGHHRMPDPIQVPAGTDYRLALVTVGLPILAKAFESIAMRPQRSDLETILTAAKILTTSNEERTAAFRDGMKLYRELQADAAPRGGDSSELFNVRDILSGVGEFLRAWRQGQPATPAPAAAPAAVAPAKSPAAELQAAPNETPEQFVERVIVAEIQRAVGSGDEPECLVILIESWLPGHVVAWLQATDDDEVLEELPKRFPSHSDYLKQEGVRQFLRRALQMLREEPDDFEEEPRVREGDGTAIAS